MVSFGCRAHCGLRIKFKGFIVVAGMLEFDLFEMEGMYMNWVAGTRE